MYGGLKLRTLPRIVDKLISNLSNVAGILLIIVAGLTVADVAMRNAFDQSILGTVDISSLLLVCIVFLGLSSAEKDDKHVSVNLLEMCLTPRIRCIFSVIRTILLILLAAVMFWGLSTNLINSIDRHKTTNGILRLSTWPAEFVLLISFTCFFIIAIWKSINNFLDIRDGSERNDIHNPTEGKSLSDSNSYIDHKGAN